MENPDPTRMLSPSDVTQIPGGSREGVLESEVNRTQAIPIPAAVTPHIDPLVDQAKRKTVEAELARLGMNPAEVKRLLDARPHGTPAGQVTNGSTPPKAARPSAASLQSFAADLAASAAKEKIRAVAAVSPNLPEFRDSSPGEVRQAEQLLRDASILRRREKYPEAEAKCREAINLVPRDAAALELLGDILQGVARTNEAIAAYKRAGEADPKRFSAEKKYGDLLIRQQGLASAHNGTVPVNPYFAVLLSLMLPGAGQIHNAEWVKGLCFFVADLVCLYLIRWSPWGFASRNKGEGLGVPLYGFLFFAVVIYIVALIDTNTVAKAARNGTGSLSGGNGWEI